MLAYAIACGAMSAGINVLYAGVSSTPALIYYSKIKKITGVIVTASHNPYYDNGIKLVNKGKKLDLIEEEAIEKLIDLDNFNYSNYGTIKYIDIYKEYKEFILKTKYKTKLKLCIDCANGATSNIAPDIFKELCDDLTIINNNPNGYNINSYCGSTHIDSILSYVSNNNVDIGFAFDGDGDRIICVDKYKNIYDGDLLIYIIAKYLYDNKILKNNTVVLTIMSNLGIIKELKKHNINVIEVNVGDKCVKEMIDQNNLSLGGEASGHIILNDIFSTGDGILIAIYILKILEFYNCDIYDLVKDIKLYSCSNINIKCENKYKILESKKLINEIIKIKRKLNDDCKIIVRPSGTEQVIRATIMAKDEKLCQIYLNEIEDIIKNM